MSGGTSALWRTSLCGVVMALTVLGTGCAIEATSDAEEEDTAEVTANLIIAVPVAPGGLVTPKGPLDSPVITVTGTQAKTPSSTAGELMEPEPDPWKPDNRVRSTDPNPINTGTTVDRSGDHK